MKQFFVWSHKRANKFIENWFGFYPAAQATRIWFSVIWILLAKCEFTFLHENYYGNFYTNWERSLRKEYSVYKIEFLKKKKQFFLVFAIEHNANHSHIRRVMFKVQFIVFFVYFSLIIQSVHFTLHCDFPSSFALSYTNIDIRSRFPYRIQYLIDK